MCKIEKQKQFFKRPSHISVNCKPDVSGISLQIRAQTSQSCQSQWWTQRLTHIGLDRTALVQSYNLGTPYIIDQ